MNRLGADWRDKPFSSWDTETTGVNVEEDRVVTSTLLKVVPGSGAKPRAFEWLINPGIEIPEGAAKIHGITTEKARAEGADPQEALFEVHDKLIEAWDNGEPISIYNAPYDCTILDRELRRYGRTHGIGTIGPVVDPLVIDKRIDTYRSGSRKLVDVARHYGIVLTEEEAHTSAGDALATARLAYNIASVQSGVLGRRGVDTRGMIAELTIETLFERQKEWALEQQKSFAKFKNLRDPKFGWPLYPLPEPVPAGADVPPEPPEDDPWAGDPAPF